MGLKVYIASITGNTEIRKQVQRTMMIIEGMNAPFEAIDITLRENAEQREWMREHAKHDEHPGPPLPPQFFFDDTYLGDYLDFYDAVEDNILPQFLHLLPAETSSSAENSRETSAGRSVEKGAVEEEEGEGEDQAEDEQEVEEDEEELANIHRVPDDDEVGEALQDEQEEEEHVEKESSREVSEEKKTEGEEEVGEEEEAEEGEDEEEEDEEVEDVELEDDEEE